MNLLTIVPWWGRALILLALTTSLIGYGWTKGAHHVQGEWDADNSARATAVSQAIQKRLADNKLTAVKQATTNAAITEGKDHEIAALTARVNAAPRMRHGQGICEGSAATAKATSPSSGNGPDSPSGVGQPNPGRDSDTRLVREDVDRDLRAYKIAVETDLATGRACQAFVRENGLTP